MYRKIEMGHVARNHLVTGIDKLANAVKVTLGASGRNVVLFNGSKSVISKDGVTVAKSIKLENTEEDAGAQLVRGVADKTNNDAGDGTTTSSLLTQAIVNTGLKYLIAGGNPIKIKRGIDKAVKRVVEYIKEKSVQVSSSNKQIEQVARVSANNDEYIGKLIADGMSKVNEEGFISVSESNSAETYIDVLEGLQLNKGWKSPYFVTDAKKMVASLYQ